MTTISAFSPDQLARVTRIVTHANCADGRACAILAGDVLPQATIEFLQHNSQAHRELEADPGILFCDFAPTRDRVDEFVAAGALILDHHQHSRDIVEAFGPCGVFADEEAAPGVAGATLVFFHVWRPLAGAALSIPRGAGYGEREAAIARAEEFATLAGIRDTWQRSSGLWDAAQVQTAALMYYPWSHWARRPSRPWLTHEELAIGQTEMERNAEHVERAAADANYTTILIGDRWHHTATVNEIRIVSDLAEHLRETRGISLCIGYKQRCDAGELLTQVSLRSDGSVDVGAIAKRLGGGGHSRAAGFQLDSLRGIDLGFYVRDRIATAVDVNHLRRLGGLNALERPPK